MPRVSLLLELVRTINWTAASQTFGSSHCTLIGLVVEAWAKLGADRYVLEGAPKVGGFKGDAILAIGAESVGVVEVEGTKILDRIQRFSRYFGSDKLSQPAFGLVIAYQSSIGGRCVYPGTTPDDILAGAGNVANEHPDNPMAVVLAEKQYQARNDLNPAIALRRGNAWAWGKFARMTGCLFHQGERNVINSLAELTMRSFAIAPLWGRPFPARPAASRVFVNPPPRRPQEALMGMTGREPKSKFLAFAEAYGVGATPWSKRAWGL